MMTYYRQNKVCHLTWGSLRFTLRVRRAEKMNRQLGTTHIKISIHLIKT